MGYKKSAKITGDKRKKLGASLKRKYKNGSSIRTLAKQTGRSYGFVQKVLRETGTTLRDRGGPNRKKK